MLIQSLESPKIIPNVSLVANEKFPNEKLVSKTEMAIPIPIRSEPVRLTRKKVPMTKKAVCEIICGIFSILVLLFGVGVAMFFIITHAL